MKHCDLCKNKKTMNCPNSAECYNNADRPYFQDKYLYTRISFIDKIKLLFKKTYISVDTTQYFRSKLYYKILHNNIYVIKEVLENKGDK